MAVKRPRRTRARPPEQDPPRHAVNLLLVSTVAAVLPHAPVLPAWLVLLTLCLIAWRLLVENRGWRVPGKLLRVLAVALAVYAVYRNYGTLLGRDAGIALLVVLTGLKMLELRKLRDHILAVLLLYFLTLGAFLYSQSFWLGLYAFCVAFASTLSLIKLSQPQTVPLKEAARMTLGLLARALPLMLIVYMLFPRIQGSIWGLPDDAFAGRTGMSDQLSPGSINELVMSDAVAFRVAFEGAPPPNAELYWRAMVLPDTDGRTWRRGAAHPLSRDPLEYSARPVRYTVTLEPTHQRWLVALTAPVSAPSGAARTAGLGLRLHRPADQRIRYAVESHLSYTTGALHPALAQRTLALGAEPSVRTRELVARWRSASATPRELVSRALAHFRQEPFVYTLTPPLLGDDPVDSFLYETQAGFCEHFAATFATLMRLAGIPSRVVVGYQGGEMNDAGNYLIVRQRDAHAWTDVWLEGEGWVRVDPTAAVAPERVEFGLEAVRALSRRGLSAGTLPSSEVGTLLRSNWLGRQWTRVTHYWDAFNNAWNSLVLDYGPRQQRSLMRWLGFSSPSWTSMAATLLAAAALVVLILAALMLVPRQRQDPAVRCYGKFCGRLARLGIERAAHEGPAAFAKRASRRRPDIADSVDTITEAYILVRYGEAPSHLAELRRLVRGFRPARV